MKDKKVFIKGKINGKTVKYIKPMHCPIPDDIWRTTLGDFETYQVRRKLCNDCRDLNAKRPKTLPSVRPKSENIKLSVVKIMRGIMIFEAK